MAKIGQGEILPDSLVKLPTVCNVTSKSRSQLYKDIKDGKFPPPVKIGSRAVAWRWTDVQSWLRSRVSSTN